MNLSRLFGYIQYGGRYWRILLLFFAGALPFSLVSGQAVRVLSTKDGLPQSFISGLAQDDTGFVWIGTRNGLARYDGIQCKIFQHDPQDSATLASNLITWMYKDKRNHLWIEFEPGEVDEMDPVTERIVHVIFPGSTKGGFPRFVRRGWLADRSGNFWGIVKAGGISFVDSSRKTVIRYTHSSHGLPSDTLRGLLEDNAGRIWVLGQQGISRFDNRSRSFIHYVVPYAQDFNNFFDSDEEIVDLHERSNGEIMWGDRRRLIFYNPKTATFRDVALLSGSPVGIRWIRAGPGQAEYFESRGEIYRYDQVFILQYWISQRSSASGDGARHGSPFQLDETGCAVFRRQLSFPQRL
jgi:hypothetical protein